MRVERTVVLPARAEDVWRAVVDPARLAGWFGGRVELEGREGGRVVLADDEGERWGTVERFEAGRRLVLRLWQRADPDVLAGSRVEFSLTEVQGGTELSVVESRIDAGGETWPSGRQMLMAGRG